MGISKVTYGDDTLIDLTDDTVTPQTLLEGYSAHGANGEPVRGIGGNGNNLATIEYTTTASKNYNVGNYLVYDGILYKVTQAISSGGTITIGTNVIADKVGDELNNIENEVADIVNVYGSKNLIPYPYQQITSSNGITWTDNGDGTITADGTATGNSWVRFAGSTSNPVEIPTPIKQLIGKEVILSSGENVSGIGIRIDLYDASKTSVLSADTSSVEERKFTIPSNSVYMALQAFVFTGNTVSNLTFRPMLRLASIEDGTYVPYVPTNAKLDEEKVSYDDAAESVQKNLLSVSDVANSTQTGITLTNNQDGTYKLSGTCTASGNYLATIFTLDGYDGCILNGAPSGSATNTYYLRVRYCVSKTNTAFVAESIDTGDGVKIEYPTGSTAFQIQLVVATRSAISNIIFKPMLRKATIKDDTWQPYIPNNTQLTTWKANGVLGAKNLIPYPYYRESGYTHNGMTSTYDSDGVITVNGTSTNTTAYFGVFNSATSSIALKPNTDYILSMKLQDATNTSIFLANNSVDIAAIRNKASGYYEHKFRTPATLGTLTIALYWGTGVTETNTKINLMLRLAEDTDDTYQPYAMTNRELTENVASINSELAVINSELHNGSVTSDSGTSIGTTQKTIGKITGLTVDRYYIVIAKVAVSNSTTSNIYHYIQFNTSTVHNYRTIIEPNAEPYVQWIALMQPNSDGEIHIKASNSTSSKTTFMYAFAKAL